MDTERRVWDWLGNVLGPLDLPTELRGRIANSACETIARTTSTVSGLEAGHIHLLIFVTTVGASKGGTWGFFGMEKMRGSAQECDPHDHSIEFYLYIETQ
jgi:hypothetical protein